MIEKEEFEKLLREILPHVNAVREILEKHNAPELIDILVRKDGYIDITHRSAEYLQFEPGKAGNIRMSFPLEL